MGHHVCLYQIAFDGWIDGCTDIRVAIHHRLRHVAGLLPAQKVVPPVCLVMARRAVDGRPGCDGRFAVFSDGEQFDDLYHHNQYLTHRLSESPVCLGPHRPVLSLPATAWHSDRWHPDGSPGCGCRRTVILCSICRPWAMPLPLAPASVGPSIRC